MTYEAMRVPPDGEEFRWRISIAQIESSGPFSDFAGHNRKMVLLRGAGVRLTIGGRDAPLLLRAVGDLAEFDGAARTDCELLQGPCTDLNFMVSKSVRGVRAWVEPLHQAFRASRDHPTSIVVAISGALVLEGSHGERETLAPWDLLVLSAEDGAVAWAAPGQAAVPLVFFATLDDNSL